MSASEGSGMVTPEGLAARLLGVTVMFSIVCLFVVSARMWLRHSHNVLGLEDWLMAIGLVLILTHNGIVIWGCFTGIGTLDENLTMGQILEGAKVMMFWQLFYVSGSLFIKSSICTTLMRIAPTQSYIWTLRILILISVVTTLAAISVVLARCKPISANWNPSEGQCVSQRLIIIFTYVVSAVNVATDWSVAIIPVFILWNVQMKRNVKFLTGIMLGIGALASVATIIRIPYSSAYSSATNLCYNIGYVILWTVVECGLGIIAGSLPMLRRLLNISINGSSQPKYQREDDNTQLVTIGRLKGRKTGPPADGHDLFVSTMAVGADDSDSAGDGESTRRIVEVVP